MSVRIPRSRSATYVTSILLFAGSFIFLGAGTATAAATFEDVEGSVHESDIDWIAVAGITLGCNPPTNNQYCPDDPVTRGQMAAFLVRALPLAPTNQSPFTDTSASVFQSDIDAAAAAGITLGCNPPTNNQYCPDDPVTRGQMASFLKRALDGGDGGTQPPPRRPGPLSPLDPTCVQVVGFSQTNQWFSAEPFERLAGDDRWQALIQGGGAIDRWIDPGFDGWSNPMASPCKRRSAAPDVVLFTVTGGERSVTDWVSAIEQILTTIATRVPSAETIILQPVVGGPGHATCPWGGETIRASQNHPSIDKAIGEVTEGRSDVVAGASPEVLHCGQYEDEVGHLTDDGAVHVGEHLGSFYADFLE